MADERIEAVITAKDLASKVIKNFSMGIIAANQATELFNKTLTALVAPFKAVVNEGAQFEQQMSRIKSISKITAQDFNALTEEAKRIGETTQFTATQAAQGMEELTRAGFDASKTISIAADAMNLAAAQGSDLADVSRTVGIGFKLFADQGLSAEDIVNNFSKSVGSSAQNFENFIEAFKFAAGQASAFNQPLSEVTKTIALLADVGFKGTLGGVALRTAISRLAKPTNQAAEALADIGLSLEDVNPETNKFTDVLKKLKAAGISNAQVLTLFGQEAGGKFIKVIQDINTLLPEYEKKLGNAKTAQESARDTLDNLTGDVTIFGSAASGLKIEIFNLLKESLRAATQAGTELLKTFTIFVKQNKTEIAAVFNTIGVSIKLFIDVARNGISVIGRVANGIKEFFALESVMSVFQGISSVVSDVISRLIDFGRSILNVLTSNESFMSGLQSVSDLLQTVINLVGEVAGHFIDMGESAIEPVTNILGSLLNEIGQIVSKVSSFFLPLWESVKEAFDAVVIAVEPVIQKIIEFVGEIVDSITSNKDFKIAIESIISAFKIMVEALSPVVGGLIDFAKIVIPPSVKILGVLLKAIAIIIKNGFTIFRDIIEALSPTFRGLIDWIQKVADKMLGWINIVAKPLNDFIGIFNGLISGIKKVGIEGDKTGKSQENFAKGIDAANEAAKGLDETLAGNTLTISLAETAQKFTETLHPIDNFRRAMEVANQSAEKLDKTSKDFDFSGLTDISISDLFDFGVAKDTLAGIGQEFGQNIARQIPGVGGAIAGAEGGPFGALAGFVADILMRTESMQEVIKIISDALIDLAEPIGRILIPIAKLIAKIINKIAPVIEKIFNFLGRVIVLLLPSIEKIVDTLVPLLDAVLTALIPFLEATLPIIEALLPLLIPFVVLFADFIKTFMPALRLVILSALAPLLIIAATINFIKNNVQIFINLFKIFQGGFNTVAYFLQNGINLIVGFVKPIAGLLKDVVDAVKSIVPGGGGGGIGGTGISIPGIGLGVPGLGGVSFGGDGASVSFLGHGASIGSGGVKLFAKGSPELTPNDLLRLPGMEAGSGLIQAHVGEAVIPAEQNNGGGNTFNFNIKAIDPMNQKEEIRQVLESLFLERKLRVF